SHFERRCAVVGLCDCPPHPSRDDGLLSDSAHVEPYHAAGTNNSAGLSNARLWRAVCRVKCEVSRYQRLAACAYSTWDVCFTGCLFNCLSTTALATDFCTQSNGRNH